MPAISRPGTLFRLGTCLLLVALVFAGWRVLSLGVADRFARSDPQESLSWWPNHPVALLALAERQVQAKQHDQAAETARAALRAYPLEGRPFRLLASVLERRNGIEAAYPLYMLAAQRSPRDLATRAWLMDYHLARGEADLALGHMDAMFRSEPEVFHKLIHALVEMASLSQAHAGLAKRLSERPAWRKPFFVAMVRGAKQASDIAPLVGALGSAPGGLDATEMDAWLARLMRDGYWQPAYVLWASALPPQAKQRLGNVFNGGFEHETLGAFDWQLGASPGSSVSLAPAQGVSGSRALKVEFLAARSNQTPARQALLLPPGKWRLGVSARAASLSPGGGLAWRVACPAGKRELAVTPPLLPDQGWSRQEVEFEVPADCPAQALELRLVASAKPRQWASGQAWFDDITVTRARP